MVLVYSRKRVDDGEVGEVGAAVYLGGSAQIL